VTEHGALEVLDVRGRDAALDFALRSPLKYPLGSSCGEIRRQVEHLDPIHVPRTNLNFCVRCGFHAVSRVNRSPSMIANRFTAAFRSYAGRTLSAKMSRSASNGSLSAAQSLGK
jgi:hypothetical protein